MQKVEFVLNGKPIEAEADAATLLVDFLRRQLGLTGTKESCREGECGACTVMLDGRPVNSCLLTVCSLGGRRVDTIEGMRNDPDARKMMEALAAFGAAQCGYCTPGMVMSGVSILREGKCTTPQEVRKRIEGNLCRCTGYQKIVDAIMWCMNN